MLINKAVSLADSELVLDAQTADDGIIRFSGYASVFNVKDEVADIVLPGAFTDTLKKYGMPKMFFSHRWDMPIGKFPTMTEKARGLWFEKAELTPGISVNNDVVAAMKHGTMDGMSIAALLRKGDYDWNEETGVRTIKRFHRLIETSVCALPVNEKARFKLAAMAGEEFADVLEDEINSIETVRQFENFLRDAGGLSKGAALALTARVKTVFSKRDSSGEEVDMKGIADLASRLKRLDELSSPKA